MWTPSNEIQGPLPGKNLNWRTYELVGWKKALMQSRIPGNADLAMPTRTTVNSSHYYCNTCPSGALNYIANPKSHSEKGVKFSL